MLKRVNIVIASLSLIAVLHNLCCLGAIAQQTKATPFQLTVQKTERPQLSRQDLESDAAQTASNTLNVPPQISFSLAQPPLNAGVATAQPTTQAQQIQKDSTQKQMLEYDVDWSKWIGTFADRWYFALRRMEESSGMQFYTVRPAQIHFTCLANGQIGNVYLKQSSGVPVYDRLQMIALSQVAVPPFPRGTRHTSVTLVQGWESHQRRPGESDYIPGSFGRSFPKENVREWAQMPVVRQ